MALDKMSLWYKNKFIKLLDHQKLDTEECRLFELTKYLPDKGVGRLVYNKYEKNYQSANLDLLSGEGTQYPETFWVSRIKL